MTPTVLSSASPTELLHYIVTFQAHPTTIIIGCPEEEFVSSVTADIKSQVTQERLERWKARLDQDPPHSLLGAPLFREVVARHIRLIFIPTVAHLRANLAVFSPADSSIPPPPYPPPPSTKQRLPLLLVYGFLHLHRDSSEWSAQGIGSSAAVLVEAARRTNFEPIIVEPKAAGGHQDFKTLLREDAPVLSGSLRRDEGGWTGRTVRVERVLGRWFRFQTGHWDLRWPEEKHQDQH